MADASKIDQVLEQLKTLNTILLGNGTPERGIVYRTAKIEEKLEDHLADCKKNKNVNAKSILGIPPEIRDLVWKTAIRLGIIFLLGKEGISAVETFLK